MVQHLITSYRNEKTDFFDRLNSVFSWMSSQFHLQDEPHSQGSLVSSYGATDLSLGGCSRGTYVMVGVPAVLSNFTPDS